MLFRIGVEASGIAIEHRADICRNFVIMPIHRLAHAQQVEDKIDLRAVLPGDRAIAPTGHRNDLFDGTEIVFRMGKGQSIGRIGIGLAIDVRNTKFVADDFHIIAFRCWRCSPICCERFPEQPGATYCGDDSRPAP